MCQTFQCSNLCFFRSLLYPSFDKTSINMLIIQINYYQCIVQACIQQLSPHVIVHYPYKVVEIPAKYFTMCSYMGTYTQFIFEGGKFERLIVSFLSIGTTDGGTIGYSWLQTHSMYNVLLLNVMRNMCIRLQQF